MSLAGWLPFAIGAVSAHVVARVLIERLKRRHGWAVVCYEQRNRRVAFRTFREKSARRYARWLNRSAAKWASSWRYEAERCAR